MEKIENLARRMKAMRASGADPYVLLIGAGASVASGTSLNRAVVERVVGNNDLGEFNRYLKGCSADERFAVLRDLVEGVAPSPGYQCLAELIRTGYFKIVLSTNFDPLLEDAITLQRLRRRDYVFLVHGVMTPDFIARLLFQGEPRVKILKLHGDLFYRKFYYTEEELHEFPAAINETLHRLLNYNDLLIVGHSMSDRDINCCLKAEGGAIWYVNRSVPPASLASVMKARQSSGNEIVGELGLFDAFFVRLRELLLRDAAGVNVDEIAQSIFSLFAPGRLPVGCGFLLADTGLVVTDSTILGDLDVGQEPGAVIHLRPFAGGPELDAALVLPPKSVLDFAVFKLNQPVARSPLELSLALPTRGDPATVCISHGSTQGFHDARMTGVECTIPIQDPKGRTHNISHLIELNMRVAEGSCGSPVVSKDGRVIGVVVAGNGASYALSVLALQRKLEDAGLVPNKSVPRRSEPKASRARAKPGARRTSR